MCIFHLNEGTDQSTGTIRILKTYFNKPKVKIKANKRDYVFVGIRE